MSEIDDIWKEIDEIYLLPERERGDIDSNQICQRYNISESAARRRMKNMVLSGEYEYVTVKDFTCINKQRRIIRKVKQYNNNKLEQ